MLFPYIELSDWLKKFPGLEPQQASCLCGRKGLTTRPVITKDWVGLAMPACDRCGEDIPGLVVKSRNSIIQKEMDVLLGIN